MEIHKDHGCDPLGNGMFKMVPSGDIVTREEKEARLVRFNSRPAPEIFGMTWDELEKKQGGKLKR